MVKTKNQRFQGNLSQDQCVTSEVFGGERLVVPIPYSCSFLCVHIRRTGFGTSRLTKVNMSALDRLKAPIIFLIQALL